MCWKEATIMSQRLEFVMLAMQADNFSELCRRFDISRKTGYKFLDRYREEGKDGLYDRSRCPKSNPNITVPKVEQLILDLRDDHPAWGPRKLKRRLEDLGHQGLPSPPTITAILKRHNRISSEASENHQPWQRFEAEAPNDLWQMDFKGYFPVRKGGCHPLTILDDHSRYSLCIAACQNEQRQTVEHHLKTVFRRYGLPWAMLMDNGPPWGCDYKHPYTALTVWLMRLGIRIIHSGAYHPQTMGKDERFHRTLKAEVIGDCIGRTIRQCQIRFDRWRVIYNTQRPHEALDMNVPTNRYHISQRQFPEKLPEIEYGPSDEVRRVQHGGIIHFQNREFTVSKAFRGQRVAIRPIEIDGRFEVFFCHYKIAQIDLS